MFQAKKALERSTIPLNKLVCYKKIGSFFCFLYFKLANNFIIK